MKHDDTHDELVKTYLKYFSVSELFERRPSVRNSRAARRELRKLIALVHLIMIRPIIGKLLQKMNILILQRAMYGVLPL